MGDDDIMGFDGGAFAFVGMYAMRHDGMRFPQTVFVVGFPILLAVGVEVVNPGDFRGVFGEMRLDA